jgi:MFS family permease
MAPKSKAFHNISYSILIGMGGIINGYGLGLFNNLGTPIAQYFNMSNSEAQDFIGLANALYCGGKMIGALFGSVIVELMGKKNTLLAAEFLGLFGYFAGFYDLAVWVLVGRVVAGVTSGINGSVCPVILTETIPVAFRGVVSMLYP